MTPARALRDYQRECIAYLQKAWEAGFARVPAVLATGLGKTEIFTDPTLLDEFLDAGKRVLIIVHTDELAEQAARKARRNNPGRRVGIVKAEQNQVTAQIIVSSRQTLASEKRRAQIRNVGLIIIDEAHHAVRHNTYGKILHHFGAVSCRPEGNTDPSWTCDTCDDNPGDVKVAGFTATLARGGKAKLSTVWQEPEIEVWEKDDPSKPGFKRRKIKKQIFKRDILFGIRRGYLLDVGAKRVIVPDFDMSRVRQTAGDYRDGDLAEEMERTFAPEIAARHYAELAISSAVCQDCRDCADQVWLEQGRPVVPNYCPNADCATNTGQWYRKGIAFWPLVDTAYHGAKAFNEAGIRSEVIHGELPKAERRALLRRLHTGETQVVHGVGVLTEGFDEPTCDIVVVARPTRSAPLYQQMVGRVLRPDLTLEPERRQKALILDVVGAGAQHDLRSLIDLAPERIPSGVVSDDASLLQIEEEWIDEQSRVDELAAEYSEAYAGETAVIEYDPLGREKLWARTPAGAWYMSAGTVAYAFLVDSVAGDPGHYDVVLCAKPGRGVTFWAKATEYVDLPLDMALGWAEELAIEVGGSGTKTLTGRKSAWRKKPATECKPGFIGLGRGLGVYVDGMTAGELSEAIDAKQAANTIDPLVQSVRRLAAAE